jgi:AAA+ superfamily predicted ATPase
MADAFDSPLVPVALRDALRLSPDNVPLMLHVAETVLRNGGFAEAEAMFKRVLSLDPRQIAAKVGLAQAFYQLGKIGAAMVIVEDVAKLPEPPARNFLLHARLALKAGEPRLAARQYQRAVGLDRSLADPQLEAEVGEHLPKPKPLAPAAAPRPDFDAADSFALDGTGSEDGDVDEAAERLPAGDLPGDAAPEDPERPLLTFTDVGGMERVKEEIRMKIILPLQQPELFRAYGKKVGGGILMYGPPGCGKTFLARATAGEVNASFLPIGISDVLDMWIGQSEKNLHAIFEQARSHRPCVLFFDEVDALGANRTDMLKSGGRQIINQFLSELDGVAASNEGVLILAATNAPWHLDPAFRRPGRFDRIVFVPPPDVEARAGILRLLLKGKPAGEVDFDAIAAKTDGYSGADLKSVVDVAVEEKLRDAMKAGEVRPLVTRDLLNAAKQRKPSVKDWFQTAKNHALYANQSGLYDDILQYLKLAK